MTEDNDQAFGNVCYARSSLSICRLCVYVGMVGHDKMHLLRMLIIVRLSSYIRWEEVVVTIFFQEQNDRLEEQNPNFYRRFHFRISLLDL